MDGPFADHAQRGDAAGLGAEALVVGEVAEGPVDRQHAVGAAGGDDGGGGPVPRVGPVVLALVQHIVVGLRAADAGGGHAHRGREIGGTEAHGDQPGRGRGDFLDMGDAGGGFDNHLEFKGFLAVLRLFHGGDEGVNGIDIGGAAHLGDHDLVEPLAGLFQKVDHVTVPPAGVEPVDAHREGLVAPVDLVDGLDGVGAGGVLVGGGDGILEVDIDDVGGRRGHLFKEFDVRARAEELAAVGAGNRGGLQAEAHGGTS